MKSRSLQLLHRFWPGLLCLLLTFSALTWLLQPRPRTFHSVQLPYNEAVYDGWGKIVSPNRHCFSIIASGNIHHDSDILVLYDLASTHELFRDSAALGQHVFDGKGNLLYLGGEQEKWGFRPTGEKLMKWSPVSQQREMIAQFAANKSFPAFTVEDKVNGVANTHCLSGLSPDGRWWIVPRMNENGVWYERVDAQTGISAGKLELPLMGKMLSHEQLITMYFAQEKDLLLVETDIRRDESNSNPELHWIDLSTGKLLHTASLPGSVYDMCLAQKAITVLHVQTDARQNKHALMAFHGPQRDMQLIPLNEIEKQQTNPTRHSKRKMSVPEVAIDKAKVDTTTMTVVYGWRYCSTLEPDEIPKGSRDIHEWSPEYYYSVRDLKTGELMHTDCLHLLTGKNLFDIKDNTLDVKTVLPGPILVLSQYVVGNEPEGFLEKAISKLRTWFNVSSGYYHKLHFIHARTGKVQNTLHNEHTGGLLQLSADEKTISISLYWDGKDTQLEYDYPLRKPWLLIWSWAVGVGFVITLLIEARRWLRHRRSKILPH